MLTNVSTFREDDVTARSSGLDFSSGFGRTAAGSNGGAASNDAGEGPSAAAALPGYSGYTPYMSIAAAAAAAAAANRFPTPYSHLMNHTYAAAASSSRGGAGSGHEDGGDAMSHTSGKSDKLRKGWWSKLSTHQALRSMFSSFVVD